MVGLLLVLMGQMLRFGPPVLFPNITEVIGAPC